MININDIVRVAGKIKADLTIKDIEYITRNYVEAAEKDPTATFDLIIENLIYNTRN